MTLGGEPLRQGTEKRALRGRDAGIGRQPQTFDPQLTPVVDPNARRPGFADFEFGHRNRVHQRDAAFPPEELRVIYQADSNAVDSST